MFKLIALSIVYLGAGNIYVGDEFRNVTETVVERKSDQNKIGKSIASYKKEQKRFEKGLEKALKNLSKRSSSESFAIEETAAFIEKVTNRYSEFINISIDKQLDIKALYSDRQWNLLVKHYLKQQKALDNARTKREEVFLNRVDEFKMVFSDVIKDSSRLNKALILLDSSAAITQRLYDSSVDIGFIDSKVLSSRISAKQDVVSVYGEWIAGRKAFDKLLIGVIQELSTTVRKKEWDVIVDRVGTIY